MTVAVIIGRLDYPEAMVRWEPNARERLFAAAVELFGELGFEEATVADIAGRAGLSERTFFRHFADKREVLFAGGENLLAAMVAAAVAVPAGSRPVEAVGAALDAAAAELQPRRPFSRERARIIASHPSLRERELIKLADMTGALADGLRRRGVGDPTAGLAAEAGMAVFRVAFEQWVSTDEDDLGALMRTALAELGAATR